MQRKRVTIGAELAAKPSALLFLDEVNQYIDGGDIYTCACQLTSFLANIRS